MAVHSRLQRNRCIFGQLGSSHSTNWEIEGKTGFSNGQSEIIFRHSQNSWKLQLIF